MRRVSHGNVVNSVIHGLFDFSLISGSAILANQVYLGSLAGVAVYLVLGVVLLVRRHRIEPGRSALGRVCAPLSGNMA